MPDAVEARLLTILGMVTDWLKFAETKTTGLVALTGTAAATLAYVAYQAAADGTEAVLLVGMLVAELFFVLSLVATVAAYFPQTDLAKFLTSGTARPQATDNLYYYGHLAKYAPTHLAEVIARSYAREEDYDATCHRSHTDLAAQIVVNARITVAKLRLFAIAAALFGVAVAVLILALLVTVLL